MRRIFIHTWFLFIVGMLVTLTGCNSAVTSSGGERAGATSGNLNVIVKPTFGSTAGGKIVTFAGLQITKIPIILIDGNSCSSVVFNSSDLISCKSPTGTEGKKDIEVKVDGQRYYFIPAGFEYLAPLSISAINPTYGRASGGLLVTITGKGFATGATVMIGGASCTNVTVVDSENLSCITPEVGGSGKFPVTVTNSNGDKSVLDASYTVYDPPTVLSISPSQGPISGGTTVAIVGSGFHSGETVLIGSSSCDSVTIVSSVKMTCTTSAGSSGTTTVAVVDQSGQQGTLSSGFTYVAPPTVAQIVPSTGLISGGTSVRILGSNFVNGAVVKFGSSICTSNLFSASDTLTCVTPSNTSGAINVTVTNPDGQAGQLTGGFTYYQASAPTVSAISPAMGTYAGSTAVTITGTNFVSGSTVTIGGSSCSSPVVSSTTSMTCTTPAGTLGAQDVVVTTPDVQSATLSGGYTYITISTPYIASISPNFGSVAGGTVVTIRGSSFQTGVAVTVDGIPCSALTRSSSSTLLCTTPAGTIGSKAIVVKNSDGTSVTSTGNNLFSYTNGFGPSISMVDPNYGPTAGGTTLTVTGANFVSGAVVLMTLGTVTVTCLNTTFVSSTQLTCTTPAGAYGQRSINVVNPDGQTGTAMANAFAYNTPYTPTVSSAMPNWGPASGGTTITISGSDFQNGAIAQIGTAAGNYVNCQTTTFVSSTQLTCVTPAGTYSTTGKIINIINPDGSTGASAAGTFYYSNGLKPTVTFVSPSYGSVTGGTSVTVLGSNFMTGSVVQLVGTNTINCTTTFVSSTQLTCVTPAGAYGSVGVQVLNPDGNTATVVTNAFAYFSGYAPVISSVSPSQGWIGGETMLSIIGSNFVNASPLITLKSGATTPVYASCLNPVIVSSTLATCTVPAASAGAVALTLYNGDSQSATVTSAFTYNTTHSFQAVMNGAEDNAQFGSNIIQLGTIGSGASLVFAVAAPYAAGSGPTTQAGKVYVYSASNTATPLCKITPPSPKNSGLFGWSMTAADISGTGANGLVIGEPGGGATTGQGKVYVYNLTTCTGNATLSSGAELVATLASTSPAAGAAFGYSVTAGKILTTSPASSKSDIVVGEPYSGTNELGAIYIFDGNAGPFNNVAILGGPPAAGAAGYDHIGYSVLAIDLSDMIGTASPAYAQVAVGAPGYGTVAAPNQGGVYILKGGVAALDWTAANRYYSVATPIQPVTTANYWIGASLANGGNILGNRKNSLLVGAPMGGSANTGYVYAYSIPASTGTAPTPFYTTAAGAAGEQFGRAIAGIGDYNGDGRDDFVIGGYMNTTAKGRFLVYSGQEAAVNYTYTPMSYSGTESYGALGFSLSSIGDINGDGRADFLVGEPWANAGGPRRGRVYIVLGQ